MTLKKEFITHDTGTESLLVKDSHDSIGVRHLACGATSHHLIAIVFHTLESLLQGVMLNGIEPCADGREVWQDIVRHLLCRDEHGRLEP